MSPTRKLRVAIECRIDEPRSGVGAAVLSLAHALSASTIEDQEYTFIVNKATQAWLEPHIFGPCRIVAMDRPTPSLLKRALRGVAPLQRLWTRMKTEVRFVPQSDGYVESNRFDLVHFTTPTAYSTLCPTIYQPHDLQHVHYPNFFSKTDVSQREHLYRVFCERAECVCVQTEWSKQDVIRHFGIAPDKIEVIPWGSVFDAYSDPSVVEKQVTREKFNLPDQFFFYPAVTWPHKNHEDIIRAVHLLKTEHGRSVEVFFTGISMDFRRKLDELVKALNVSAQVHFLGFVTPQELQSIFSAATAMIFASKFEGFGLPILEAFHARLPVISSNASVLPEVARDGALYFTPGSPGELAGLMMQVLDDSGLRERLVARGTAVLSASSICDMAKSFQRLYARTANKHERSGLAIPQLMVAE